MLWVSAYLKSTSKGYTTTELPPTELKSKVEGGVLCTNAIQCPLQQCSLGFPSHNAAFFNDFFANPVPSNLQSE